MTIANGLTVLRIILVPVFVMVLLEHQLGLALAIFAAAALTDMLDGYIARRTVCTTLGQVLDPVADKIMIVTTYIILPMIQLIPIWLTVLVVTRDIIIAVGYGLLWQRGSKKIMVSRLGKICTFVQSLGAGFFILIELVPDLAPVQPLLIIVVAVITVWSGGGYISQGIRARQNNNPSSQEQQKNG